MFKLSRAFVIAAVLSSTALCAPLPQDTGKPISTGQSVDPSAPASSVFGTTPQDHNYQNRPTELCVVPVLAKDAGLSQGQEQLTAQQAIQLCSEAKTIAVSSKSSKRSPPVPNNGALIPPLGPEPQPGVPHPARSVNDKSPKVGAPKPPAPEPVPGIPQPPVARDVPPQPAPATHPSPEPIPGEPRPAVARSEAPPPSIQTPPLPQAQSEPMPLHPVAARSDVQQPPKDGAPPLVSKPAPGSPNPKPHVARDLPRQPEPVPQPAPVPAPQPEVPHPVVARSQAPPPPQNPAVPEFAPLPPHPALVRSVPEQPPKVGVPPEPLPGSPAPAPAPDHPVARSQGQPKPAPQPLAVHEPTPQPDTPRPVTARSEPPQVPHPNTEVSSHPIPQPGAPLPAGY
ncbi:hypothetical protein B0J17DRAFT_632422 [Rhizoctonia solani]|nr:hypothetical protein B0J17DRAFT_632422 [Rhizoctonia solani]